MLRDQPRIELGRRQVGRAKTIANLAPRGADLFPLAQDIPSIAASWLA
jgi:hypothetical protein